MKRLTTFILLSSVAPFAALASTYDAGDLVFTTEERQSVWGPGEAAEIAGTYFAGATWDVDEEIGDIAGKVSTSTVPDITYSTRLAAWNTCKDSWFSDLCGSKPKDGSFEVKVDTRTGAELEVETSGKAGFDLNYKVSAGSFGATVEFDATAEIPDEVIKGEAVTLSTMSVFTDGTINNQSPTAEASVDAVLKVDASASATGCVALLGCTSGSGTILSVDEDRELVGIDLNQITYLDGFLPEGAELKTALANQSVTLKMGVINGVPTPYVDAPFLPPPPGASVGIDLGAVEVTAPIFNEDGGKVGGALEVKAQTDFIDVTADLDTLFGLPGGFSTSFGPLGVSLDAYDFDAGPSLDVFQDLRLTPSLLVDLDFSQEVEIAGNLVKSFKGAWDALPAISFFKDTIVTPKYMVEAVLESSTGFQIGLGLSMDFLKASFGLGVFDVNVLELALGPLFEKELNYDPEFARLALYDDSFDVGGFNMIEGNTFAVNISPIPLPAGAWLMFGAFGCLSVMRRRPAS